MKGLLCILLIMMMKASYGQNYSSIDWRVRSIDASTPDSLAKCLTAPYTKEVEKARAIFSWIAQHISYNTFIMGGQRGHAFSKSVRTPGYRQAGHLHQWLCLRSQEQVYHLQEHSREDQGPPSADSRLF